MPNINALSQWLNRAPFHYAWVIVGILALVQMVALSINFAGGVLVGPLTDPDGDFGFSFSNIGFSFGVYYLSAALLAPVAGWLGDRYGPRNMMILGAVSYCAVLVLVAFVSAPWQLWLSFGLLRGAVQAIFMVPLMAAVSGWFRRRLGMGTGILWAAVRDRARGNVARPEHTRREPELADYIYLYRPGRGRVHSAAVAGVPQQAERHGHRAYGALEGERTDGGMPGPLERARVKVFNQHVRRTKAFWNLPAIHGLGCAGHGIVLMFVVPFAVMKGLSFTEAAIILSILSVVSIPSRMLTPMIAEKYGTKTIMATCLMIQGLTVICLFFSSELWHFYAFAMLFGIGFGGEWTGYLVINRQYYGNGPMGSVYGWQMSGALMGHAFVSWIAGLIVDLTGSYNAVFALSIAASVGGALVTMSLEDTSKRLIGDWEAAVPEEAQAAAGSAD